jgi:hypothetical protein
VIAVGVGCSVALGDGGIEERVADCANGAPLEKRSLVTAGLGQQFAQFAQLMKV